MKKALTFLAAALALAGCQKKYELDIEFKMPDELVSPSAEIALDVTSSKTVTLAWNGGAAADGGIILYNVLFDKEGGNFSEPIETFASDLGASSELTLTHAQLNTLARKAGVKAGNIGSIIWTVTGSKGGVTKTMEDFAVIRFQRGEGIDNIPEQLFVNGAACTEKGQQFRKISDGLFVIYTKLTAGKLQFTSAKDGGSKFYADATGKLAEGDVYTDAEAVDGAARITVNFNTLSVTTDKIGEIYVENRWDQINMAELSYVGNGRFEGVGEILFSANGDERYSFHVMVNDEEKRWGSNKGNDGTAPDGTEAFWDIYEQNWDAWNNLWKFVKADKDKSATFVIETNKDNRWFHSVLVGEAHYDQPSETPEVLYLSGDSAEAQDQQMRKEGSKFVIYNKFTAGSIRFTDGTGKKYFADAEGKLFIGGPKTAVEASESVTRVTVDFESNTVNFDKIGDKVYVENNWDHIVMATMNYQSLGKYAGEGKILFAANGDERYSLRVSVNGTDVRWGSNKGNDGTAPDGTEEFWYIYESAWGNWDNLWKFNKEDRDKEAAFGVDANNLVHMRHSVTVKSGYPEPPAVAPETLALHGTGAETEGQKFRKVSAGVFVIYSRLTEGTLCFRSEAKNYFLDPEKGLLEGAGEGVTAASEDRFITRITVDFNTCTVRTESIDTFVHLKFAASYRDVAHLEYAGNGIYRAANAVVRFVDQAEIEWITWGFDERYYFIVKVDGVEKCWGRLDEVTGNDLKPNDDPKFYWINEFSWEQWEHCWKFAAEMNGATADLEINTNDNGVWRHTVTKK